MTIHRAHLKIGLSILSIVIATTGAARGYELTRGRQLLIHHGLQIQSLVYPTGFTNVELWHSANFTTFDFWQWTNLAVLNQLPFDQQWARNYEPLYPFTKYLDPGEASRANTLVRYQYSDELPDLLDPTRLSDIAATYAEWRQIYPYTIVHTNSYYNQWSASQLATYMQVTQPDMVMFDYYPQVSFSNSQRNNWYASMQLYRRAGLAGNDGTGNAPIPYAQFLRTFRSGYDQPKPSESFIRLQQFASWAFGYTLVNGFIYTHIDSPDGTLAAAMFDSNSDSMPNEVFGYVKETNRQSRNLGPALIRLVSTDIRMVRGRNGIFLSSLPSGLTSWSPGTANTGDYVDYITAIQPTVSEGGANDTTHADILVGYFNPLLPDNSDLPFVNGLHFMIVNGAATGTATESAQWYRLTLDFADSGFDSLVRMSRETGEVEHVPLTHLGGTTYYLDLNLPGGTGDLFGFWNSSLSGDYNGDGFVDAADYTVWRNTLDSTTFLAADGNLNGTIDAGDYDVWKSNYGATPGSGSLADIPAAVPEPSSQLLSLIVAVGCMAKHRRVGNGGAKMSAKHQNTIDEVFDRTSA